MGVNDYRWQMTRPQKRRKSTLSVLMDIVMLILTVLFAFLLLLACMAKHVDPAKSWIFAFAGLGAPVLYIVNTLLLLFWIIRWRIFAAIPLAILIFGISNLNLFFKPSLGRHNAERNNKSVYVMTYNVMGFIDWRDNSKKTSSIDSLTAFIREHNPDIVCLQEFQAVNEAQKAKIDSLIGMPYNEVSYIRPRRGAGWGLAVYSRYKILDSGAIKFDRSTNSMLWCDLLINKDTVRIFNNHLQTTSVNNSDKDFIMNQEFLHSEEAEDRVRGIMAKLRDNFIVRAQQADSIAPLISSSPYPALVCGDFNDTPMSYVYTKIKGSLKDSFAEKGRGMMPNTFKGLYNIFRIDYIMHSPELKAIYYSMPDNDLSDHKAVFAGFEIKN